MNFIEHYNGWRHIYYIIYATCKLQQQNVKNLRITAGRGKKWEPFHLMVYCCSPMFWFFFIYAFSWFRFIAVAVAVAVVLVHALVVDVAVECMRPCSESHATDEFVASNGNILLALCLRSFFPPIFRIFSAIFWAARNQCAQSHNVATMIYAHKSDWHSFCLLTIVAIYGNHAHAHCFDFRLMAVFSIHTRKTSSLHAYLHFFSVPQ